MRDDSTERMKRRRLLAATGAGLLSALAGCSSSSAEEEPREDPEFQETTPIVQRVPLLGGRAHRGRLRV